MTATEPGGWELKRSIDQLRNDVRDDIGDLKTDVNGVGSKLDSLDKRYVPHSDHNNLARRVDVLEQATAKRTDRNLTIWLTLGVAFFGNLVSVALAIFAVVTR